MWWSWGGGMFGGVCGHGKALDSDSEEQCDYLLSDFKSVRYEIWN